MELDLDGGDKREKGLPATGGQGNPSLLNRVRKELADFQLQSTLPSCTVTLARDKE